jgi:hypothetical protein
VGTLAGFEPSDPVGALVAEIEADIAKVEGGNKAAGTRVRKQMQKIEQAAQRVRNRVLELRRVQ